MHEISLVQTMLNTLQENFGNRVEKICQVKLTAGLLSNVQPVLMQNAFAAVLMERPEYRHISLIVEVLPIVILCNDCGKRTEVKEYRFICSCGKPSTQIIQGEELIISQVEFMNDIDTAMNKSIDE